MEPVDFKGSNTIIAKDQKEYKPLPALVLGDGEVITCWELTDEEVETIVKERKLYISQLTFNRGLQPLKPLADLSDAYDLE